MVSLALSPKESHDRLWRIGRIVSVGSLVCAAAIVIGIATAWSNDQLIQRWIAWPGPLGIKPITINFSTRVIGALLSLIGAAPFLYALVQLSRLFSAFTQGIVFEIENTTRIRNIGLALLARVALSPIIQVLTTLALTINNPPNARMIGIELEVNQFATVLGGLALIAFASVMREAVRLSRENREFV